MREEEKMTVKPGLEKKYEEYVNINQDPYGNAVIVATAKIGKILDDKEKTPEQAYGAIYGEGLTGFMAGLVSKTISFFHPRGEEFRIYWNNLFGVNEEEAKGGVVNPAIMTIIH